jgi:hypothetical protein
MLYRKSMSFVALVLMSGGGCKSVNTNTDTLSSELGTASNTIRSFDDISGTVDFDCPEAAGMKVRFRRATEKEGVWATPILLYSAGKLENIDKVKFQVVDGKSHMYGHPSFKSHYVATLSADKKQIIAEDHSEAESEADSITPSLPSSTWRYTLPGNGSLYLKVTLKSGATFLESVCQPKTAAPTDKTPDHKQQNTGTRIQSFEDINGALDFTCVEPAEIKVRFRKATAADGRDVTPGVILLYSAGKLENIDKVKFKIVDGKKHPIGHPSFGDFYIAKLSSDKGTIVLEEQPGGDSNPNSVTPSLPGSTWQYTLLSDGTLNQKITLNNGGVFADSVCQPI